VIQLCATEEYSPHHQQQKEKGTGKREGKRSRRKKGRSEIMEKERRKRRERRTSSRYSMTALNVFFPLSIAFFRASESTGATETVVVSQMVA
jgi:hypothetical protein